MIRATLDTANMRPPVLYQDWEEEAIRIWLKSKGFNLANRIKITHNPGRLLFPSTITYEQFPAPSFRIRPNLSEFIDTKAEDRNKRRWEKEGSI